jgi:hypothetical protein
MRALSTAGVIVVSRNDSTDLGRNHTASSLPANSQVE